MIATLGLWLAKHAAGRWLLANIGWLKWVAAAIAAVLALWWLYARIYDAGYDAADRKWKDAQQQAQAEAQADSAAIVEDFSGIDLKALGTIETLATVRTVWREREIHKAHEVYRERPGCALPDELWRSSDKHTHDLAATAGIGVHPVRPADAAGER